MRRKQSKLIMGSAIGLAAIAVAIDHTRHTLPEPTVPQHVTSGGYYEEDSPCSLDSPCSMDESPCSLDETPCSLE
ncbi:MAG: hypothetical protein LJE74_07100 [Proteobacteria bacterium]|jgi:hypothetical protein|nr:hypothetical protein [Pseudomonadota bacterium]